MVKEPPKNAIASQYYVSIDYGTQNATVFCYGLNMKKIGIALMSIITLVVMNQNKK